MNRSITTLAYAAGMGAIAGLRSMAPLALLSRRLSRGMRPWDRRRSQAPVVRLLTARHSTTVLTALSTGEMIADKTPFVPARVEALPLVGRAVMGAFCGAAIAAQRGGSQPLAAVLGAGAAVGATHLAYRLRKEAGEASGVPDVALALVEDAFVLTVGHRLAASAV